MFCLYAADEQLGALTKKATSWRAAPLPQSARKFAASNKDRDGDGVDAGCIWNVRSNRARGNLVSGCPEGEIVATEAWKPIALRPSPCFYLAVIRAGASRTPPKSGALRFAFSLAAIAEQWERLAEAASPLTQWKALSKATLPCVAGRDR